MNFKKVAFISLTAMAIGAFSIYISTMNTSESSQERSITHQTVTQNNDAHHRDQVQQKKNSLQNLQNANSPQEQKIAFVEEYDSNNSERQKIVDQWDEEYSPPEPNDMNYGEWIDSPFSAEVNLENAESVCIENCADALNEQPFAEGSFADQVNPDALRAQAIREGLIDPDNEQYLPMPKVSSKTPPPTDAETSTFPE